MKRLLLASVALIPLLSNGEETLNPFLISSPLASPGVPIPVTSASPIAVPSTLIPPFFYPTLARVDSGTSVCEGYQTDSCLMPGEFSGTTVCTSAHSLKNCEGPGSTQTWSVSFISWAYAEDGEETTFVYNVSSPTDSIRSVNIAWTGNCCLTQASYDGFVTMFSDIPSTDSCQYGVNYNGDFLGSKRYGLYNLTVAGFIPPVEGGTTIALSSAIGFCSYKVMGPDCSICDSLIRVGTDRDITSSSSSRTESVAPAMLRSSLKRLVSPNPSPSVNSTAEAPDSAPASSPTSSSSGGLVFTAAPAPAVEAPGSTSESITTSSPVVTLSPPTTTTTNPQTTSTTTPLTMAGPSSKPLASPNFTTESPDSAPASSPTSISSGGLVFTAAPAPAVEASGTTDDEVTTSPSDGTATPTTSTTSQSAFTVAPLAMGGPSSKPMTSPDISPLVNSTTDAPDSAPASSPTSSSSGGLVFTAAPAPAVEASGTTDDEVTTSPSDGTATPTTSTTSQSAFTVAPLAMGGPSSKPMTSPDISPLVNSTTDAPDSAPASSPTSSSSGGLVFTAAPAPAVEASGTTDDEVTTSPSDETLTPTTSTTSQSAFTVAPLAMGGPSSKPMTSPDISPFVNSTAEAPDSAPASSPTSISSGGLVFTAAPAPAVEAPGSTDDEVTTSPSDGTATPTIGTTSQSASTVAPLAMAGPSSNPLVSPNISPSMNSTTDAPDSAPAASPIALPSAGNTSGTVVFTAVPAPQALGSTSGEVTTSPLVATASPTAPSTFQMTSTNVPLSPSAAPSLGATESPFVENSPSTLFTGPDLSCLDNTVYSFWVDSKSGSHDCSWLSGAGTVFKALLCTPTEIPYYLCPKSCNSCTD